MDIGLRLVSIYSQAEEKEGETKQGNLCLYRWARNTESGKLRVWTESTIVVPSIITSTFQLYSFTG